MIEDRKLTRGDFQALISLYQHELLVHCYRMLGSPEDAEDALQETFLRAWRRFETLVAQEALRPWLYRIATNVSLDMIDQRMRLRMRTRSVPTSAYPPADPDQPLPAPLSEAVWLEPLPEEYLDWDNINPEARYEARESINLAFLTVLQELPGRQRAVLLLRDVLGWKSQEVADLLETSLPSVNSALQRARLTMVRSQAARTLYHPANPDDPRTTSLLARYVQAWETADTDGLMALLRDDAILSMPPFPAWFSGKAAIRKFIAGYLFAGPEPLRFRLVATRANGSPAFAVYQREGGQFRPSALQVLSLHKGQIVRMDDFLVSDERLFSRFHFPLRL
jgi:RNA polymerase sigma-70 factor (ECF subfamily)